MQGQRIKTVHQALSSRIDKIAPRVTVQTSGTPDACRVPLSLFLLRQLELENVLEGGQRSGNYFLDNIDNLLVGTSVRCLVEGSLDSGTLR